MQAAPKKLPLIEVQRGLAKLALKGAAAANELNLAPEEIVFFARSLRNKRRKEVGAWLPRLSERLGPEFDKRFGKYTRCRESIASTGLEEALKFSAFLEEHFRRENRFFEAALAEYEQKHLRVRSGKTRTGLSLFRFDPEGEAEDRCATLILWFRTPRTLKIRRFKLRLPLLTGASRREVRLTTLSELS